MGNSGEVPLREQSARLLTGRFGKPEQFRTIDGTLYRWVLMCDDGRKVRLTLDSPEFPDLAHVLISDSKGTVRLTSETCRTIQDVQSLMDRLEDCARAESMDQ